MCSFESTEREHERLRTPIEELDFEQTIEMGACCRINWYIRCSTRRPAPPSVEVASVCSSRRLSIHKHPEP